MAIFRKYELESKEQFEDFKLRNNLLDSNIYVELGNLRDDKYSVDILWSQLPPEDFKSYEIWDIEGNGSHTFLGWNFNQNEQYL